MVDTFFTEVYESKLETVRHWKKNNSDLRQIGSEGHAKYGYSTSDMKRDILKK